MNEARYLYCIADSGEKTSLGKVGINGNEVYTISYKDVCAVVHNCPTEPYKSEDDEVVRDWIMTHQNVVDAAWKKFGAILPSGFDTIIKGEENSDSKENMMNWLKEDYESLKGKLERVKGKAEYGVQVFWDLTLIAEKIVETNPEIKDLDNQIKSKSKGTAYMYKQKLESTLKKEIEKRADEYFKDFYNRIKKHVDDIRAEKTKKTEKDKKMLMNLSCLVDKDKCEELGEELEKVNGIEGLSVRFTGPWPPYSFV